MKKALLLVVFLVFGCKNGDPVQPNPSFLDGTWTAFYRSNSSVYGQFDSLDMKLNLIEYQGDIGGNATIEYIYYQKAGVNNTIRTENDRQGEIIGKLEANSINFKFADDNLYPFSGQLNQDSTQFTGIIKSGDKNETEIEITFKRD